MTKKIEIEVPDELYGLERWATNEGISLSDLIQRELGRTKAPTFEEISAWLDAWGPSGASTANTVRDIREARGD